MVLFGKHGAPQALRECWLLRLSHEEGPHLSVSSLTLSSRLAPSSQREVSGISSPCAVAEPRAGFFSAVSFAAPSSHAGRTRDIADPTCAANLCLAAPDLPADDPRLVSVQVG